MLIWAGAVSFYKRTIIRLAFSAKPASLFDLYDPLRLYDDDIAKIGIQLVPSFAATAIFP